MPRDLVPHKGPHEQLFLAIHGFTVFYYALLPMPDGIQVVFRHFSVGVICLLLQPLGLYSQDILQNVILTSPQV